MATYTQTGRLLNINSPLGKDALLLTGFSGREEMSRLFSFQLELLSDKEDIAAQDIVGKNVTFSVFPGEGATRYFNGFVSRFSAGGLQIRDLRFYRAEVVPWLWFLTRTADCRIFQNKNVPDIIQQIFKDLGFTDFKLALQGSFQPREYCVQYRETDFNFVSRLMEEEGIFYFFTHEDGKHTLTLTNQKSQYKDCAENELQFYVGSLEESHVTHWEHQYEFRPGKWAQTDYNFETPSSNLMSNATTLVKLPGVDKFEIYDYPGEYPKKDEGERLTKIRMEEDEAPHDVVHGGSNCSSFFPGGKFRLKNHPVQAEAGKGYVITSVRHSANDASYTPGGRGDQEYGNTFTCIPDSVLFRPARITPKPIVQGSQTAVVVGAAGEEIYPDKYGRVIVQFHWDREGKKNEKSSCWIRVATPCAGKQWGMIHIPRIGQEVIVDFLEGDPDRPIIIGSVYNAEQMPPYTLPANKTQSGIVSRSSLKGTPDNFNEICFEDKKGEELIYIRAEKDQTVAVENDEAHWVGHDRLKTVDNDETTLVHHDRTETVDNNETITIGNDRAEKVVHNETIDVGDNRTRTVGKNETITVALMRTHTVGINEAITIGAAQEVTVGAMRTLTVGASQIVTIGRSETVNIGTDQSETIGKNRTTKVGKDRATEVGEDDTLKVGKVLAIDAGERIVLKTGDAMIEMRKDGTIIVKGKDITVRGSGEINVKADKDITMKGQNIKQN